MAYGPTWWSRSRGLYEPCPLLEWNGMVPRFQGHDIIHRQITTVQYTLFTFGTFADRH